MKQKPKIAIFCGARFPKIPEIELQNFKNEVQLICSQLAQHFDLVYGGGSVGLMGLVADTFLQSKAYVHGVIPNYLNTVEIQHTKIQETIQVLDLHERKAKIELLADYFLILPGGIGTVDEFFEVLTLKSLSRHKKAIYVWNWRNFFNGPINFIEDGIELGFVSSNIIQHCVIETESDQLLKNLLSSELKTR